MKNLSKTNIVIFLILIAIGFYIILSDKNENTEAKFKISELLPTSVEKISIKFKNSKSINFVKDKNQWVMSSMKNAIVENSKIERILDVLTTDSKNQLVATNLEKYGLDDAYLLVTFNSNDIYFGEINDITNEQYVLIGNKVFLIQPHFSYNVSKNPSDYFSRRILSYNENPLSFEFSNWKIVTDKNGNKKIIGNPKFDKTKFKSSDLEMWAGQWKNINSLSTKITKKISPDQYLKINLSNGKNIFLEIRKFKDQFIIYRTDNNLTYTYGNDAGERLINPYKILENSN